MTQLTIKDMKQGIDTMVATMGLNMKHFINKAQLPTLHSKSNRADVELVYNRLTETMAERNKLVSAITMMGGSADITMRIVDLTKLYNQHLVKTTPANDESSAAGKQSKEETTMTTQPEMVTKAYMEEQLVKLASAYDSKIERLLAALEEKNAVPAPTPAATMPVAPAAPVTTPEEVAADAKAKLEAVKVEDANLRTEVNAQMMIMNQYPIGSAEYQAAYNAMVKANTKRKITMAYIRSCTADGLRKFADVQESSVGGFIEWTRGGIVAVVNLIADGAKSVNTGIANGVRFTADVVDPNATVSLNPAKA